jgi:hypothetical protein
MIVLVSTPEDPRCVTARRSYAHTRLLIHLRSRQLDRELAAGACPDSSALLSLRARELISRKTRNRLAREILSIIKQARNPACVRALNTQICLCRRKVQHAALTLEELAAWLCSDHPVDARGLAQLRLLLIDGAGPLYHHPEADDLQPALAAAIEALTPDL